MITRYAMLLRVTLRHTFYGEGLTMDFAVEPAPATRRWLKQAGLIMRPLVHGFAVYAEIEPDTDPPTLLRPLSDEALRMAFLLRLVDPFFLNITAIDPHAMGAEVFYFSNLGDFRDDPADPPALGDPVDAERVGTPVRLVPSGRYVHSFGSPAVSATLTITDVFGNTRHTEEVAFEQAVDEAVLRLDRVDDLPSGRYSVADNHGGQQAIYYAPDLFGDMPFGIVELFSRTDTLTPGGTEQVPADYRFLDGREITAQGDYIVQFEARATTWRYVVTRKYDDSIVVTFSDLDIPGGGFTKSTSGNQATFTSNAEIPLSEGGIDHDLEYSGVKLLDLPSPGRQAPLQEGSAAGRFTSEMYVYV